MRATIILTRRVWSLRQSIKSFQQFRWGWTRGERHTGGRRIRLRLGQRFADFGIEEIIRQVLFLHDIGPLPHNRDSSAKRAPVEPGCAFRSRIEQSTASPCLHRGNTPFDCRHTGSGKAQRVAFPSACPAPAVVNSQVHAPIRWLSLVHAPPATRKHRREYSTQKGRGISTSDSSAATQASAATVREETLRIVPSRNAQTLRPARFSWEPMACLFVGTEAPSVAPSRTGIAQRESSIWVSSRAAS